ncbi:MAG: amidohydrolase family protein [Clostridia bacterium]
MLSADLIIRNGHVYDPCGNIDFMGDIAVKDRKIVAYDPPKDIKATKELNVQGCWVVPGLIDAHTHCNWLGNYIGMPTDIACIPYGVTATIDAGSTGVSNYRSLLRYLDTCETKTKIMLHLSASGQIMSSQFAENIDPSVWDMELFERAFQHCGDRIVGLKLRASKAVLKELGLDPLHKALKLADHLNTRLFLHSTDPLVTMSELTSYLRPHDVVAHMYHGEGETMIKDGRVAEGIIESRKRGVIFDVSQGKGGFSIEVARASIAQGFLPDTISTDLNAENWNNPLDFSLLMTMSKHMALGMSFEQVLRCVTGNAAEQMGMQGEIGTLAIGTCADITILKTTDKAVEFRDIYNNTVRSEQILMPLATIIDGQVLYRTPDTL